MLKRILTFAIVILFALFAFKNTSYSNKNFAPTGNTNAPNENTCAKSGCHSSFPLQENRMDKVTITANGTEVDASFEYIANTAYDMQFVINDVSPNARNGFSMTVLDETNTFSGTLTTSSTDAQISNGAAGKKYIGHTNSAGLSSWDFTWTAPADSHQITFYGIANVTNTNNFPSGDSIITKEVTFTMAADTTTTSILSFDLDEDIIVFSSPNELKLSIDVGTSEYYTFELFSLNGQLIFSQQEILHYGKQYLNYEVNVTEGLYILNVSSQGKYASYKVLF